METAIGCDVTSGDAAFCLVVKNTFYDVVELPATCSEEGSTKLRRSKSADSLYESPCDEAAVSFAPLPTFRRATQDQPQVEANNAGSSSWPLRPARSSAQGQQPCADVGSANDSRYAESSGVRSIEFKGLTVAEAEECHDQDCWYRNRTANVESNIQFKSAARADAADHPDTASVFCGTRSYVGQAVGLKDSTFGGTANYPGKHNPNHRPSSRIQSCTDSKVFPVAHAADHLNVGAGAFESLRATHQSKVGSHAVARSEDGDFACRTASHIYGASMPAKLREVSQAHVDFRDSHPLAGRHCHIPKVSSTSTADALLEQISTCSEASGGEGFNQEDTTPFTSMSSDGSEYVKPDQVWPVFMRLGGGADVRVVATAPAMSANVPVGSPSSQMAPMNNWKREQAALDSSAAELPFGSRGHATGTCKPCAHFWKPAGCSKGDDCERCHLCDQHAFKKYRDEYKAVQRKEKLAARRRQAPAHRNEGTSASRR